MTLEMAELCCQGFVLILLIQDRQTTWNLNEITLLAHSGQRRVMVHYCLVWNALWPVKVARSGKLQHLAYCAKLLGREGNRLWCTVVYGTGCQHLTWHTELFYIIESFSYVHVRYPASDKIVLNDVSVRWCRCQYFVSLGISSSYKANAVTPISWSSRDSPRQYEYSIQGCAIWSKFFHASGIQNSGGKYNMKGVTVEWWLTRLCR